MNIKLLNKLNTQRSLKFLDAMHYVGGNKNDKSIDDFLTLAMLLLEGYISTNYDYENQIIYKGRDSHNQYVQLAVRLHTLWDHRYLKSENSTIQQLNITIQTVLLNKSEINRIEDCILSIRAKGIWYCKDHKIKTDDRLRFLKIA